MAYRQVKDLLQWTASFHETLGAQYRRLSTEHADERMKMALDFLADRAEHMHHSMIRYIESANSDLLDVWLLDSQEFVHPRLLDRIPRCMGCRDPQDVLANVLTAHQTLKDMYRLRAELGQMPAEKQLFQELADNQDAEARLQTRDLGRLDMY